MSNNKITSWWNMSVITIYIFSHNLQRIHYPVIKWIIRSLITDLHPKFKPGDFTAEIRYISKSCHSVVSTCCRHGNRILYQAHTGNVPKLNNYSFIMLMSKQSWKTQNQLEYLLQLYKSAWTFTDDITMINRL